jgi:hypothetical protein
VANQRAAKRGGGRQGGRAGRAGAFEFEATIAFLELEIATGHGNRARSEAALDELRRRGWDVRPVAAEGGDSQ